MATPDEMEVAAKDAENALTILMQQESPSADDLISWWGEWYIKAGHKRLGRMLADRAKKQS